MVSHRTYYSSIKELRKDFVDLAKDKTSPQIIAKKFINSKEITKELSKDDWAILLYDLEQESLNDYTDGPADSSKPSNEPTERLSSDGAAAEVIASLEYESALFRYLREEYPYLGELAATPMVVAHASDPVKWELFGREEGLLHAFSKHYERFWSSGAGTKKFLGSEWSELIFQKFKTHVPSEIIDILYEPSAEVVSDFILQKTDELSPYNAFLFNYIYRSPDYLDILDENPVLSDSFCQYYRSIASKYLIRGASFLTCDPKSYYSLLSDSLHAVLIPDFRRFLVWKFEDNGCWQGITEIEHEVINTLIEIESQGVDPAEIEHMGNFEEHKNSNSRSNIIPYLESFIGMVFDQFLLREVASPLSANRLYEWCEYYAEDEFSDLVLALWIVTCIVIKKPMMPTATLKRGIGIYAKIEESWTSRALSFASSEASRDRRSATIWMNSRLMSLLSGKHRKPMSSSIKSDRDELILRLGNEAWSICEAETKQDLIESEKFFREIAEDDEQHRAMFVHLGTAMEGEYKVLLAPLVNRIRHAIEKSEVQNPKALDALTRISKGDTSIGTMTTLVQQRRRNTKLGELSDVVAIIDETYFASEFIPKFGQKIIEFAKLYRNPASHSGDTKLGKDEAVLARMEFWASGMFKALIQSKIKDSDILGKLTPS